MSAFESLVSTAVGFAVSWVLTFYVLPFWGYTPSVGQALEITFVYTLASFLRGWAVRAFFRRVYV